MHTRIEGLKQAQPYFRLYRNETFVIKIGGGILDDESRKQAFAGQIALLCDLGIRVVLVHGGGPQASRLSRELGIEPQFVAGRRVTTDEVLNVAVMTYAGSINTDFCAVLNRHGVPALGLTGVDGRLVDATKRPPVTMTDDDGTKKLVDFGHVGDIQGIGNDLLRVQLDAGFVPTLACLCADNEGKLLNINADGLAQAIAVSLNAKKLIFVTGAPGVLRDKSDPSSLIPFADHDDLVELLDSGAIDAGMRPKLEACLLAAEQGVERTHIIGTEPADSLLVELFTGEGCGTMIVNEREKRKYQDEELSETD